VKRQHFLDCPTVIGKRCGHGRSCGLTSMAQTCVRRANVIDRPDQLHPVMPRPWAPCQGPASPRQHRQTFAERCVQPLDSGRVDHAVALRATPARLDARWCAIHHTAFDVDPTPLHRALDHVRHTDVVPGPQPRASMGAWPHRITKRLVDGPYIGAQAVDTDQERAGGPHSGAPARGGAAPASGRGGCSARQPATTACGPSSPVPSSPCPPVFSHGSPPLGPVPGHAGARPAARGRPALVGPLAPAKLPPSAHPRQRQPQWPMADNHARARSRPSPQSPPQCAAGRRRCLW
jgi:hypothetical protein